MSKSKTRDRITGVARYVQEDVMIRECSYRDGKEHGLMRSVRGNCYSFFFFDSGECKATVMYNIYFKEIFKHDPDGYLKGLEVATA